MNLTRRPEFARCPLCRTNARIYADERFDNRLHFYQHGVCSIPRVPCEGSGWIVEAEDIAAKWDTP